MDFVRTRTLHFATLESLIHKTGLKSQGPRRLQKAKLRDSAGRQHLELAKYWIIMDKRLYECTSIRAKRKQKLFTTAIQTVGE